jgi:polysaccharide deacetylase family protein (PEP-CTERM system associated)
MTGSTTAETKSIAGRVSGASATSSLPACVFSVDVEDWFHILDLPSTPPLAQWDSLPSRVENNFRKLLDIFDESGTKVTCFFLAWVAERFPHLVTDAARRGHEIASHGYAHHLAYEMGPDAFFEDCRVSKQILEQISGRAILGYRAAGFSATNSCDWFFEKLAKAGYRYDSSVFPARRGHGGIDGARREPHTINCASGQIVEFPVSVTSVAGATMCFFGGGYLRLFPYCVTKRMSQSVLNAGRPVLFYIHPREIDPGHPRLSMNRKRRFKSYVNLRTTETKIRRILADFTFTTFEQLLPGQLSVAADASPDSKVSGVSNYESKSLATHGEA